MSLLTYSGITTKVRAMESHLISERQFREMAGLEDVRSAAEYLRQQPAYAELFTDLDDDKLHRGYIEQLLTLSKYRDFTKLYRFSNLSQRKFLDLYFMHYEIDIIKRCLRNVMSHQNHDLDLSMFRDFFEKHSGIDLVNLAQANSLAELIAGLEGSIYYPLLAGAAESAEAGDRGSGEGTTLFDYELKMDLLYFKTIWKAREKLLGKKEQQILAECFGCQLDLMNVQWIYRSKKYYALPAADIYALLIPVQYRLKPAEIRRMVEAATLEEFFTALQSTRYGNFSAADAQAHPDLEALNEQIQNRIYHMVSRKNPYTIAILDSYLYFKELEKQRLVTTIEGIRYGLNPNDIIALVIKSERRSDL